MSLNTFLGPWPDPVDLEADLLERVDCGSYVREKLSYAVAGDQRASAYVCIPKGVQGPLPAVFCHHQPRWKLRFGKARSRWPGR